MANPKKKKILVTGGMGFIGHNVVKLLQSLKHNVQVIDALTTYGVTNKEELEYLYNQRLTKINKKTQVYKIDIADAGVDQVFESFKPDVVIHLASFPRQATVQANPTEAAHTMCKGLVNVLDCCARHEVAKVLYASSSMVYGNFDDAKEDDQLNPSGSYSIWKIAGEELVKEYNRTTGLDYVIVRPTAVYGPMDISDRVISKFLISAMRDETLNVNGANETLDFTFVDDCATGIVLASLGHTIGTYNISRSHRCTIAEAANLAVKIVGKGSVNIRDKDKDFPSRGKLNTSKAQKDFKFDPKIDIDKGLEMYYNWIKDSTFYKVS
jgi:nucleoside-diphosphate-sugar epimerase|tara:strand:+ start:1100 stop:2071 length:972 start_codon:yes stop_codon:yes gene_type:complete